MKFDNDASQSSTTFISVQHKLTLHNLYYRKERPAYPVVILPHTLHAVQYMLHDKQSIN